jgi:hypothetical protein
MKKTLFALMAGTALTMAAPQAFADANLGSDTTIQAEAETEKGFFARIGDAFSDLFDNDEVTDDAEADTTAAVDSDASMNSAREEYNPRNNSYDRGSMNNNADIDAQTDTSVHSGPQSMDDEMSMDNSADMDMETETEARAGTTGSTTDISEDASGGVRANAGGMDIGADVDADADVGLSN